MSTPRRRRKVAQTVDKEFTMNVKKIAATAGITGALGPPVLLTASMLPSTTTPSDWTLGVASSVITTSDPRRRGRGCYPTPPLGSPKTRTWVLSHAPARVHH